MSLTLPAISRASLGPMVAIEARRFAKHPLFLAGTLIAFVTAWLVGTGGRQPNDLLAWPVIPAFFIGTPSLIVAARLTRSTEAGLEAIGTAPGGEAQRTLAVACAAVVPFAAGVAWLLQMFVILAVAGDPHPEELWFGTLANAQVWGLLIGVPVTCLGGALLGVVVGRWLRFPGAPAVAVVVLLAVDLFSQLPFTNDDNPSDMVELRLWAPFALFHSGHLENDTSVFYAGNAVLYVGYQLALCALAVWFAVWHDRAARTPAVRGRGLAAGAVAVVLLVLAMVTGPDSLITPPFPV